MIGFKTYFPAHVDRNPDDHGGKRDGSDQRDSDRRANERAQLPQDLLLPAPGLLPPERAA